MERILRTGEKNGVKRSMLVVGHGLPIAVAVSGANVHATQLLQITLDNIVTERPDFNEYVQNSCLDAGYTGYYDECAKYGYVVHIRPRGEEKKEIEINSNFKARCRIVEVVHFRINRFKKLSVRFEKKADNYWGLLCKRRYCMAQIAVSSSVVIFYLTSRTQEVK